MKTIHSTLGAGISALGLVMLVMALSGFLALSSAPAPAAATGCGPNNETVLPADGITSIERTGDSWIMATDGIPSEVKVLCPVNRVICSMNASLLSPDSVDYLPPCGAVTVFGAAAECVYVQVDGLAGHNSSDPYVCRGLPSATPTESSSAPPTPTETSTPTPSATSPVPSSTPTTGPSSSPSPSPSPTASSTPTPPSTSSPEPPSPSPTTTATALAPLPSASASPTGTASPGSHDSNPFDRTPTLASTGLALPVLTGLGGLAFLVLGIVTTFGRKKETER